MLIESDLRRFCGYFKKYSLLSYHKNNKKTIERLDLKRSLPPP
ncbi:hypothetical protein CKA32_006359 [Geitlerinema sp. FC II]|nr:hypothetical protein CKA32_006359 [Geitlerinema sp. FC II]